MKSGENPDDDMANHTPNKEAYSCGYVAILGRPNVGKSTLLNYLLGQKVNTLVNTYQEAGSYRITWEGRDDNNNRVASGVYLYRVTVNDFTQTKKMMLVK